MARHGENIHKRKDGRWEARFISAYNSEGKAVYKSVYGHSYEEVRKKRLQRAGNSVQIAENPDLTFAQVAEMWLNDRKNVLKTSSYNQYFNQCHLHLFPELLNVRFSSLNADMLSHLLKRKEAEGYSPNTIISLRTILKMIIRYAEKKHINCNIDDDVYMPRNERKQIMVFTVKDQKILDSYLSDNPNNYSLAILISLYCGLRIGEVCALTWKDIDFRNETIHVSSTLIRVQNKDPKQIRKTEIIFQKPKTESSCRIVPIPDFLIETLNRFKNSDDVFVITGTKEYMEPRICLRKFKAIIHMLDLNDYTFHACRHTYATRCIELGIDAKILSELLGHTSVKTTLDRYVHPSIDVKKQQVNKLRRPSALQ